MGAFISKQPNGLYCRFSSVVDCPTHWNMTKEDYISSILKKLYLCDDISFLDLIDSLLDESVQEAA